MKKNKRTCIGILGGGQLARMSALQAYRLGFDVAVLEKEKDSPAGQLTHKEFIGWVDNKKVLRKFADECSVITLENEFVDYHFLEYMEDLGCQVIPSSNTILLIQDKFVQKSTLRKHALPVPRFLKVNSGEPFEIFRSKLNVPFLLKSRKMGYDGYGNALIKSEKDFSAALKKLKSRHTEIMAEEFINFKMELAVMVVRTSKQLAVYPVVQTIQRNHICHIVIAPAPISKKKIEAAKEIAVEAVRAVDGYGIFGIEFFLSQDGKILINEIAPRTHNSGHYTIESCVTSQFENHIRAVLNLPLGDTSMVQPHAVMINLLGKKTNSGIPKNYEMVLKDKNVHLHIYGKAKSRIGRKMGHITLAGTSASKLFEEAKAAEKLINI